MNLNSIINRESVLKLLILLFPILLVAVQSGGSVIYTLIFLIIFTDIKHTFKLNEPLDKLYFYGFLALFCVSLFSLFFSEDLKEGMERMDKFFRLLTGGLIYLYFVRKKLLLSTQLMIGVMLAALLISAFSYYEVYYLNHAIAQGNYYRIGLSAYGVMYAGLLFVSLILLDLKFVYNVILVFALFAGLYASYLSGGRGGWIAIPFILIITILLSWKSLSITKIITIFSGILATLIFLVVIKPQQYVIGFGKVFEEINKYITGTTSATSVGARLDMWGNSGIIFLKNPVFGTGLGDFDIESEILIKEGLAPASSLYGHAHNIIFDAMTTTGAVGLMALLVAMFIIPLYITYKTKLTFNDIKSRNHYVSLIIALLCYFIFGLSEAWLTRNIFVNGYVIIVAVLLSSLRISSKSDNKYQP